MFLNVKCFHMIWQLLLYCRYQREVGILIALQAKWKKNSVHKNEKFLLKNIALFFLVKDAMPFHMIWK